MSSSSLQKIPESVLVVIHTKELEVLLLKRADMQTWQSVTGSKDFLHESWAATAQREVLEETQIDTQMPGFRLVDWGIENRYEIYPAFRHRYPPQVSHNLERVFALEVPKGTPVVLSPREHTDFKWLPYLEAADQVFSPSNAEAILNLKSFMR
ncbi:MAG: dihydroneopterin triphosphate diphosphatase [Betaproteobacteria bacterium]|jgi:dATP pyrophosphohydrolase